MKRQDLVCPILINPLDNQDRGRLTNNNNGTLYDGCKCHYSWERAQIPTRDVCDEISRISGMSTFTNGPNGDHQCKQNGQRQGWVANRGVTEKCRSYAPLDYSVRATNCTYYNHTCTNRVKGTAVVAVVQSTLGRYEYQFGTAQLPYSSSLVLPSPLPLCL